MIFDFDNSKTISKDELIIMIISFIRGIGCMTNSILYDAVDIEPLGKHCFEVVGIDIKKNVSLEDLTHWVSGLTEIVSLFSKHDKLEIIKKGKKIENHERRKSNTAAKTTRRGSITLGLAKITDNYRSRNQSKGITLEKPEWKNRQRDEKILHKIFFQNADGRGYAPVGVIYQSLMENKRFERETEFFFHEFNFDLNAKLEYHQLISYFEKVNSKNGYFVSKGNNSVYPKNQNFTDSPIKTLKVQTLKKMFNNLDKDKDGFLTLKELKEGLLLNFSKETIREVFESYDGDGNNLIDFREFLEIFTPNQKILSK